VSEAGVIPPPGDRPHEVGRVTGPTQSFHHQPNVRTPKTATLRVVIHPGCIQLCIGKENVFLDAVARDRFMRDWMEAERQLEAADD
jgi:hypothetical protein